MKLRNVILGTLFVLTSILLPVTGFTGQNFDIVISTDSGTNQLVSYYDLRNDRESFVQVSNVDVANANIHVQIFRNDLPNCQEINFYDTLTPNDTHIYNMRDLVGNALPVNIDLADDSNGMVVITLVAAPVSGSLSIDGSNLIGNFRILDASGYEYRTNSAGVIDTDGDNARASVRYTLNFNQISGNNFSDIVGIEIDNIGVGEPSVFVEDWGTFVFIYNNAEIPTSCDEFEFECGGVSDEGIEGDFLNVGINDIFPSTNGDQSLCAGNLDTEGFVELLSDDLSDFEDQEEAVVGFIGLNNGNGTGSMDSWFANNENICEFLTDDFDADCDQL